MFLSDTYQEKLPLDAPPSYRGTAIKYSYKVVIGTQRFDYPTKLIRIPLRVLVVPGNPTDTASLEPFACKALKVYSSTGLNDVSVYGESNELKPTNPFAARNQDNSILDIAMEILQTVSCRRNSSII